MFEIEQKKQNPIQIFVFAAVFVIASLFIFRLILPSRYAYVAQIETQLMSLEFNPRASGEIKWRTEGIVFCSATALALPELPAAQSMCGSKRLKPYHSQNQEQVLEIVAAGSMQLSIRKGGGLQMSLRSTDRSEPVAKISLSGSQDDVNSASQLILLWPNKENPLALSASHGVYPFKGKAVVGKDVGWSRNRLLLGGEVSLFSSDLSATTGRREITRNELMLGDQLALNAVIQEVEPWYRRLLGQACAKSDGGPDQCGGDTHYPQGFVYYQQGAKSFELRAFGNPNGLVLTRYADSNFDLKPGLFARLSNDPLLAWMTPFLLLLITLGNNLKGLGNISPKFIKLIKKRFFGWSKRG